MSALEHYYCKELYQQLFLRHTKTASNPAVLLELIITSSWRLNSLNTPVEKKRNYVITPLSFATKLFTRLLDQCLCRPSIPG